MTDKKMPKKKEKIVPTEEQIKSLRIEVLRYSLQAKFNKNIGYNQALQDMLDYLPDAEEIYKWLFEETGVGKIDCKRIAQAIAKRIGKGKAMTEQGER